MNGDTVVPEIRGGGGELGQIEPVRVVRPTGRGGDGDHHGAELGPAGPRLDPRHRTPGWPLCTAQVEIELLRGRIDGLRDPEPGHTRWSYGRPPSARQPG